MNRFLFLCFPFLLPVFLVAQNLVPNSSFEEMSSCPVALGQFVLVDSWFTPNAGTPDYFNDCSVSMELGTEYNCKGGQLPHSGHGYMGFISEDLHRNQFYEYIEARLKEPLEEGRQYCVTLFVSLGNSNCALRELGAVFSHTPIKGLVSRKKIQVPYIPFTNKQLISDSQNWVCLQNVYSAKGGESYITIGDFSSENVFVFIKEDPKMGPTFQSAYYFIDDVSVELISEGKCSPQVNKNPE